MSAISPDRKSFNRTQQDNEREDSLERSGQKRPDLTGSTSQLMRSDTQSRYRLSARGDRSTQNPSKTKNEDSFSEQSHQLPSNSKRSLIPEQDRERFQEYYEKTLISDRQNIEDSLNAFWEKRIEEISMAYQRKIDRVKIFYTLS